ncbi:MAG: TrpR-like protein, YerC/YecD [Clostridia bacterium]|nr:TrpR-like protein, YerC/YecD [Clostridia bacterium]
MANIHSEAIDRLFQGILSLETVEECYNFFEDVCTVKEIVEIAQRFEVAGMLSKGESYQEISKRTGASTATISRVNKCLTYGSTGYKTVLDRVEGEEDK